MEDAQKNLEMGFDDILFQLSKGITIDQLKSGKRWYGFEQVKEWKNKMGYKLHIYSNDHLIDNNAHFHLVNEAEAVDCKFNFHGNLLSCAKTEASRRVKDAVHFFCQQSRHYEKLVQMWNYKNPSFLVE